MSCVVVIGIMFMYYLHCIDYIISFPHLHTSIRTYHHTFYLSLLFLVTFHLWWQSSSLCGTVQCVPISGLGFRRGSYKCVCRKGYYFPDTNMQLKYYNGSTLEEEYEKYMLVSFVEVYLHAKFIVS